MAKGKLKINKELVKKLGALGIALTLVTATLAGCSAKEKKDADSSISMSEDQFANLTFEEFMQLLEEGIKKDTVLTVYNFLDNFNGDLAMSLYLPGDEDKKFQIPWDTAIAMLLAYNNYSDEEMFAIFDTYNLQADDLYRLVKGYTTMAIPAYMRLTNSTNIADLIRNQETKDFYTKYENQLIKINKARFAYLQTGDESNKISFEQASKEMHEMIRADFLNNSGSTSFGSQTESYASGARASVVPIVSAVLDITRNTPTKLTDEEIEEINLDGYCNTIEATLQNNIDNLRLGKQMAISKEPTTAETEKKEIQAPIAMNYETIRNMMIQFLQKDNKYFKSDALSTLPVYDFNSELAETLMQQANVYVENSNYTKNKQKKYNNKNELVKDYPNLKNEAEKQEKDIQSQYDKENEEARKKAQEQADKDASKKSEDNKNKADQEIKDKNTTAGVKDNDNNSYDDYKPNSKDTGDVVIDDKHTTKNQNGDSDLNFDGPIYDKDGNIIYNKTSGSIKLLHSDVITVFKNCLPKTISKVFTKRF